MTVDALDAVEAILWGRLSSGADIHGGGFGEWGAKAVPS